jgi:hypothetical protein
MYINYQNTVLNQRDISKLTPKSLLLLCQCIMLCPKYDKKKMIEMFKPVQFAIY